MVGANQPAVGLDSEIRKSEDFWENRTGKPEWLFVIHSTTGITPLLLSDYPLPADRRVLVIPGGRANLLLFRAKHDQIWLKS